MTKKQLFEDIKQEPPRFYRTPGDVLRDRRFSDAERRDILMAWRALGPEALLPDIAAAIEEVENCGLHAAE